MTNYHNASGMGPAVAAGLLRDQDQALAQDVAADAPVAPDTTALHAVADNLDQLIARDEPERAKALRATLIVERTVNSRREILPTYQVGEPVARAALFIYTVPKVRTVRLHSGGAMAIEVVSGGLHGEILLIDRKEDGTALLLVCDEWEAGQEPNGPVVLPNAPPEIEPQPIKSQPKRTRFPMGLVPAGRTGTLTLDVTALSPGLHAFVSERFCRTVVALLSEGAEEYVLRPGDEGSFGLRATLGDEVSIEV